MTRALAFAVAAAAFVLVAGCGGGDSKETTAPTGTSSPITQPTGPTTATPGATSKRPRGTKSPSQHRVRRVRKPSPSSGGFGGQQGDAYVSAKASCRKTSVDLIKSFYRIQSNNPRVIARLYVNRIYRPPLRRAAFEGCYASLSKKSK